MMKYVVIKSILNFTEAYFETGNVGAAEKCYQTCIDSKADCTSVAQTNMMSLCLSQTNIDGAADIAKRLRPLSPELELVHAYSCKWDASNHTTIRANGSKEIEDHHSAYRIDYPKATNLTAKMPWQRAKKSDQHPGISSIISPSLKPNERIKVAYMSSGFGNHTIGFLIQSIFAHYKKARFHVQAISLSPCDESSEWEQMKSSVDKLVIVGREMSSQDLASMIRDDGIHVLVDLDGHTKDSRQEVFAMRAAPVQISMLGHLGTSESYSGIDFIVADGYTLAATDTRSHLSKRTISEPFIVNSYRESKICAIDFDEIDRYQIREDYGIPEDSFVFACFSQPYKISPEIFSVWMEILKAVPNSQLILVRYSRVMEENLRTVISSHSVAQDRVLFWDLVSRHEHMLRCCIVDVVLDTLLSGVATSYDAIWTNTPLVTIAGVRTSDRLGASLLNYLGLNQLIASNLDEYKLLAISLSQDEDKYMDIIRALEDARDESDLFDCKLWVDRFEDEILNCMKHHSSLQT
jgi:predicted O-linked N-acetylglucosamine transferase (SPINDLY family)